jgi:hypothetical protein
VTETLTQGLTTARATHECGRRGRAGRSKLGPGRQRALGWLVVQAALTVGLGGCARGPETEYGASRGASLNGSSAFAAMLRAEGHEVQTALKLNDHVASWAEGIVRFATYPGAPDRAEAQWYREWLDANPRRWLIYVVRDFDTVAEYWGQVRDGLPGQEESLRAEATRLLDEAVDWVRRLPSKRQETADPRGWFGTAAAFDPPQVCSRLSGDWSQGIDPAGAGLTLHEALEAPSAEVLLRGDDRPFVVQGSSAGASRYLAIANGSFLLNEALVNPARRAMAERVLNWAGEDPCRVALVEGSFVLGGPGAPPSFIELLERLPVVRWVAAQMGLAGLLAALARAPRLGRPRDEPPSGADRPAAHAEALGALLARVGDAQAARALLETYRQWRHPRTSLSNHPT